MRTAFRTKSSSCSSVRQDCLLRSSGTATSFEYVPNLAALSLTVITVLSEIFFSRILSVDFSTTNLSGVTLPCTTDSPIPHEPSTTTTSLLPVTGSRVKHTPDDLLL